MMKIFEEYVKELNDFYDRYEKIVKISRDITIEAKKIIFLLHGIDLKSPEAKLGQAKKRLDNLVKNNFQVIANELHDQDHSKYLRAFIFGVQEFVEAYSFFEYLSEKSLSDWDVLIQYNKLFKEISKSDNEDENNEKSLVTFDSLITPLDYILGLADVTGELMRFCIVSLGLGYIESCHRCCKVLQKFYSRYSGLEINQQRDFSKKLMTLKQNVLKAEQVCYSIKIRSKEEFKVDDDDNEKSYLSFVSVDNQNINEFSV